MEESARTRHAEMRRKDRQLTEAEAWEILRDGEHGVLSTVCPDGTPYAVPIHYALVDRALYMHCSNAGGQKLTNIAHRRDACFTVVGRAEVMSEKFSTLYMSAIAFGPVQIVDEEEKRRGIEAILHKYSPEHIESGMKLIAASLSKIHILRMDVEALTGKGRKS